MRPYEQIDGSVVVYRAAARRACDERALLLVARGIECRIAYEDGAHTLAVAPELAARSLLELFRYQQENAPAVVAPPPPLPRPVPGAWLGAAFYVALLLLVGDLALAGAFGRDWLAAGRLETGIVALQEPWRAVTALFLHADAQHLLGNAGFGALLGWMAGQSLGPGLAWGAILVAGTLGNLATSRVMPAGHGSIGASTAVFAALGLLGSLEWRRRRGEGIARLQRWAPWGAALGLLAMTGTAGEHTNLAAHLFGFGAGAALGALAGPALQAHARGVRLQWLAGGAVLLAVTAAWSLALR